MARAKVCFLIDDDEDDREIFIWAVREGKMSVGLITADNGQDALDKLNADKELIPDYIFLDLNMPVMNGIEFLTAMKEIPRLHDVSVYIYSTSSQEIDKVETVRLGAVDFIVKPSSVNELVQILSTIIV